MGRNKVDGYDDDVPGGFKKRGWGEQKILGPLVVAVSLFIHCNSIVVDRWLIVSRCRPSRTQHGPSQPDNQIISRIKNGDRS